MFIKAIAISGVMVGVEYLWNDKILVLDLLIVRLFIGVIPNKQ